MWEGVGGRTELQYIDPHSYGHQRCVSLILLMLKQRPRGPLCLLSLLHLISNFSGPQLNWGPQAPSAWRGFPYHISSITLSPTVWLLSWLSYIIVQRPLNCLLDLWNGMFDRHNFHAVHRSLSSGASVYECTIGFFFTLSHFISQILPMRFLSITGHWDVSLPSGASLWNGILWPSRRSKYNSCIHLRPPLSWFGFNTKSVLRID